MQFTYCLLQKCLKETVKPNQSQSISRTKLVGATYIKSDNK